jgi:hypothetical protein
MRSLDEGDEEIVDVEDYADEDFVGGNEGAQCSEEDDLYVEVRPRGTRRVRFSMAAPGPADEDFSEAIANVSTTNEDTDTDIEVVSGPDTHPRPIRRHFTSLHNGEIVRPSPATVQLELGPGPHPQMKAGRNLAGQHVNRAFDIHFFYFEVKKVNGVAKKHFGDGRIKELDGDESDYEADKSYCAYCE